MPGLNNLDHFRPPEFKSVDLRHRRAAMGRLRPLAARASSISGGWGRPGERRLLPHWTFVAPVGKISGLVAGSGGEGYSFREAGVAHGGGGVQNRSPLSRLMAAKHCDRCGEWR
jgi:hypothetical protein